MLISKSSKDRIRIIENHLRYFNTYLVGIKNCEKQLDYIMPTLVSTFCQTEQGTGFFIPNNTSKVALDRIDSKRALDLKEEIEKYRLITDAIKAAVRDLKPNEQDFVNWRYFECLPIQDVKVKLGYSEEKSVYRIRKHVLDKLSISLNNLISLK